jgi:L-ascorbate metabolism protein UlaG (beta-lactamase superfamily)
MSVQLTWYGHSAFKLESGKHSVLIDPFISGNPSATVDSTEVNANTIILTHAHNDHVGDTVEIAKRNNATVIATFELANYIGSQGVKNATGGNHGGTIGFPGGTVKFVPAWHTSSYNSPDGVVAPEIPAGLVVRFGGKTIYFAGDTCLFLDMQLIGEEGLDVAVLPIGDTFTMGPKDAARAAGFLKAQKVIPCHYDTFPPIAQDTGAFGELLAAASESTLVVPVRNEPVEL